MEVIESYIVQGTIRKTIQFVDGNRVTLKFKVEPTEEELQKIEEKYLENLK